MHILVDFYGKVSKIGAETSQRQGSTDLLK
jgi:hypothetical protein